MIHTETVPLSDRRPVDVRSIERELAELWRNVTETHDSAVTRVCVLNLVIATTDARTAHEAGAVAAQLMASHPNRSIVLYLKHTSTDDSLDVWVQAHCQLPGPGRPQVCCEQITIEARGTAVGRVPGTVLPLLVPEVPVMIWWPRGEPFEHPLLTRLARLIDRLIVDSASFATPETGLARLAQLLNADYAISDLAWTRLTAWRELTAQFFDSATMLPYLDQIRRVTIEYESHAEDSGCSEALLFAGWLAAQLGWSSIAPLTSHTTGRRAALHRSDGSEVLLELRTATPRDDLQGRLVAVTLACDAARFSIQRSNRPNRAVARSEIDHRAIERVMRLERLDLVRLLTEELRLLGHDHTFERALRAAAALTS